MSILKGVGKIVLGTLVAGGSLALSIFGVNKITEGAGDIVSSVTGMMNDEDSEAVDLED